MRGPQRAAHREGSDTGGGAQTKSSAPPSKPDITSISEHSYRRSGRAPGKNRCRSLPQSRDNTRLLPQNASSQGRRYHLNQSVKNNLAGFADSGIQSLKTALAG